MGVTDEIFRIVSVRFSASHKPVATKKAKSMKGIQLFSYLVVLNVTNAHSRIL